MQTIINSDSPNEGLKDLLKPFYHRASDAEDRLSRLEAVVSSKNGSSESVNVECSLKVKELELKLEEMTAELLAEREKVAKLTTENSKKDYRIIHLIRAVEEGDKKLKELAAK